LRLYAAISISKVGVMRAAKGHCDKSALTVFFEEIVGVMRAAKGHCDTYRFHTDLLCFCRSHEMVLKYRTGNFCNFQSNETRNEYEEEVQKV